jgi:hypothetical protein
MAARYVNTENVAAQGQSFYTGLLPGSYEKGGGGGGTNVMGRGSGGSAGVTADRTAVNAAKGSIEGYPRGGTVLGKQPLTDSDRLDRIAQAIQDQGGQGGNISAGPRGQGGQGGNISAGPPGPRGAPGTPGYTGGAQGQPPPRQVASSRGGTIDADSEEITTGSSPKALGPAPKALGPGAQGLGAMIPGAPSGGVGQGTRTPQGLGTGQKPQHGPVQSIASSRSHTRQSGVQQSATQQSIPFPNMPNSTNRSLNF